MTPEQEEQIRFRLANRKFAHLRCTQLIEEHKASSLEYRVANASYDIPYREYVETVELLLAEIKRLRNEHQ